MKHRIPSSRWELMMIISSIFLTLNTVVFGVPLSISYSSQENIKKEHNAQEKECDDKKLAEYNCIINGSKYEKGEHVPGAGPCEECICQPPNVICSMMKCPINSGCITIQLPNKCCPQYKCDCEHKGKLYNNGEKINKSDESACRVCFCNGGEIVCTSIVCYTRNDCLGYYLPGDCCPKYDNCSSTSIDQKSRDSINSKKSNGRNIDYWSHSTEKNDDEDGIDGIWKRDTANTEEEESPTAPSIFDDQGKVSRLLNISFSNYSEELDTSKLTPDTVKEGNITYNNEPDIINTTHNLLDIVEDSKTSFLGFETDNLTTNIGTTDSSLITNYETSEIIPKFEELFGSTDIDNSVIITHQNGTETIIDITETPAIGEIINSSTESTTSTQVEIFNPSDLALDTKQPMMEFSTITPEFEEATEMDYEDSREATTPSAPDKSTIGTPHKLVIDYEESKETTNPSIFDQSINRKPHELVVDYEESREATTPNILDKSTNGTPLKIVIDYEVSKEATIPSVLGKSTLGKNYKSVMDSSQTTVEEEISTEITFTDLEDTTDMFGPNFGQRSYKTQKHQTLTKSDTDDPQIKKNNYETTLLPTILIINKNNRDEDTTKSSKIKLFDQSLTNLNTKSIENNTSLNIENVTKNNTVETNKETLMNNGTNFMKLEAKNITTLNDKYLDSEIDSTLTTPFIIETKVLPNQAPPRLVKRKLKYPKEYPDEFETIQNGPSVTITKRTYTSIPDIVYTTTTMVTLPTLDLIYKADKEIEKYFTKIQSTTSKPHNSLSPLQNISSLNFT